MSPKYILSKSSAKNPDNINAWFDHCQKSKIPYVTIEARTKFATIEWDYISLPARFDEVILQSEKRLIDGFEDIYSKYANPKSEGRLNSHVSRFINIETNKAEALASDVYDFVSEVLGLNGVHA